MVNHAWRRDRTVNGQQTRQIWWLNMVYVCTYVHMYVTYANGQQTRQIWRIIGDPIWCMYVRMYICTYVHVYVCTYDIVRMYVCTYQGYGLRRHVGNAKIKTVFFLRNRCFSPGPYDLAIKTAHPFWRFLRAFSMQNLDMFVCTYVHNYVRMYVWSPVKWYECSKYESNAHQPFDRI